MQGNSGGEQEKENSRFAYFKTIIIPEDKRERVALTIVLAAKCSGTMTQKE